MEPPPPPQKKKQNGTHEGKQETVSKMHTGEEKGGENGKVKEDEGRRGKLGRFVLVRNEQSCRVINHGALI